MSKAQELLKNRQLHGNDVEIRGFEPVEGARTLESYYEKILSDNDVEAALAEYQGNYDKLTQEFIEKTRLQRADVGFLFFATMLQCARIYVINRLTEIEQANVKGGKEDTLHEFQEKVLGKFSNGAAAEAAPLYASLEAIITMRGVPYDAQAGISDEIRKMKLFKGANHRFSTLGHDPVLGLIFGTANILTNTITTNRKLLLTTNNVVYDAALKNPKVGMPVSTVMMLDAAGKRFEDDKESVAAAVIKQLIHIATDMYTPCGIQLPGAGLVLSNTNVEHLTEYISTGDVIKTGASAGMAVLINTIISAVHGCKLMFTDDGNPFSKDMYQARTRKIVMYSNVIASSSNIISTAVSKDVKQLDVGGLLVTIYRIFSDTKFINKLEYEFINSGLNDLYNSQYAEIEQYYK